MIKEVFADYELETNCSEEFGLKLDIVEIIARDLSTGQASRGTLFKTKSGQIYLYISALSLMTFGEVRLIVKRMQCEPEIFCPPSADRDYFERVARDKFQASFPGKKIVNENDLNYYRTLASYNPALIKIARINGEVCAFDRDSKTWRKAIGLNYSKLNLV